MSGKAVERIDSHQHFWNYDAAQYPWIAPGSPLQRDWLPQDLVNEQAPLDLHGSIAVQARQTVAESLWLLGLSDQYPVIHGVVGWVDLRSNRVEEDLAALAQHPKFVGVRHVAQDEPDDRFLAHPEFSRGIGRLRQFGLAYDLLIYPRQLPAAIELAEAHPDQLFVLDHIAKPEIRMGTIEPWRKHLTELARLPNVWCKVSGMITEADHQNWQKAELHPYLDTVFEAFGSDRIMWGSDWPVCLLAGSYTDVYDLVEEYTRSLAAADREAIFGGNAAKFYLGTKQ